MWQMRGKVTFSGKILAANYSARYSDGNVTGEVLQSLKSEMLQRKGEVTFSGDRAADSSARDSDSSMRQ
jgi:hypothetical protein